MKNKELNLLYSLILTACLLILSKNLFITLLIVLPHLSLLGLDNSKRVPTLKLLLFTFDFIFVFRYFAILSNQTSSLGQIQIEISQINNSMVLVCLIFSAILILIRFFQPPMDVSKISINYWIKSKDSNPYLKFLFSINAISFVTILLTSGGVGKARAIFFSHQKLYANDSSVMQLALTLMAFFFLPFLTLLVLKGLNCGYPSYLIAALALIASNLYIFGGRLTIFMLYGIVTAFLALSIFRIPILSYIAIGLISIAASLSVLSSRTGVSFESFNPKLLNALSYPVLDAFTIVSNSETDLRSLVYSPERFKTYLVSFVPRFLWPDKPKLTEYTLDTSIANSFGYSQNFGKTGWPSGFLTDSTLFHSPWIYLSFILFFSGFVFCSERFLLKLVDKYPDYFFINFYIYCNVLITFIKDGDILTCGQLLVKLILWLNVSILMVRGITHFRERLVRGK